MLTDRGAYLKVLRDLRARKADLEKAIAAIETLMPGEGASAAPQGDNDSSREPVRSEGAPTIVGAAMELLRSEGRPVHVSQITKYVKSRGVTLNSADEANTVGSILNRRRKRKGDLVRTGRGTWALASLPLTFPNDDGNLPLDHD